MDFFNHITNFTVPALTQLQHLTANIYSAAQASGSSTFAHTNKRLQDLNNQPAGLTNEHYDCDKHRDHLGVVHEVLPGFHPCEKSDDKFDVHTGGKDGDDSGP